MDLVKLERETRHLRVHWPVAHITENLMANTTGINEDGTLRWLMRFRNPLLNLLFWFPHFIISDECEPTRGPLLVRWHLLRLWGGRAVMLHCFLRSDNSRHYHDHPWPFITFLLSPYREHVPDVGKTTGHRILDHEALTWLYRPANWLHWVETLQPLTWTLVYHGPKERPWGFVTERGWLDAIHEYRNNYPCE